MKYRIKLNIKKSNHWSDIPYFRKHTKTFMGAETYNGNFLYTKLEEIGYWTPQSKIRQSIESIFEESNVFEKVQGKT